MLPALFSSWKPALAALLLASVFGCGWKLRDYQAEGDALKAAYEQAEARDAAENRRAAKDEALEAELNRLRASKQKIQIIREKELAKPAYDCLLPDAGRLLLNGRVAAGQPAR